MLPICYEGLLTFLTEILRLKVCSAVCSCYLIHKYFVSISTYGVLVKREVGVGVSLFLKECCFRVRVKVEDRFG